MDNLYDLGLAGEQIRPTHLPALSIRRLLALHLTLTSLNYSKPQSLWGGDVELETPNGTK